MIGAQYVFSDEHKHLEVGTFSQRGAYKVL